MGLCTVRSNLNTFDHISEKARVIPGVGGWGGGCSVWSRVSGTRAWGPCTVRSYVWGTRALVVPIWQGLMHHR